MTGKPTLVIEGGCVVTGDARDTRFQKADIVVLSERIVAIS